MAAFDYCTAAEAFGYGGSAGTATDPVNEAAFMATLVTEVSRAIDQRCQMIFYADTFTDYRCRGRIDRSGALVAVLPSPTITALTSLSLVPARSIDLTNVDSEARPYGSIIRVPADLLAYRQVGVGIPITISYSGGWTDRAALPADLRLAAQAAAWYEFQRRFAPQDTTANPALGIVTIPGDWPANIRSLLAPYVRSIAR